jgi:hypothetical protein
VFLGALPPPLLVRLRHGQNVAPVSKRVFKNGLAAFFLCAKKPPHKAPGEMDRAGTILTHKSFGNAGSDFVWMCRDDYDFVISCTLPTSGIDPITEQKFLFEFQITKLSQIVQKKSTKSELLTRKG